MCLRAGGEGAGSSMLCMPVFGADGAVAGVVQVVGKKGDGGTSSGGWVPGLLLAFLVTRFELKLLHQRNVPRRADSFK